MDENKHIIVTYGKSIGNALINKVDESSGEGIENVEFEISQLEDGREEISNDVIGEMVNTSPNTYNYYADRSKEIPNVVGELTNGPYSYNFVDMDGKYIPTNSKTYQLTKGKTAGIKNSDAFSYIPIDLTGMEGNYKVVVNAEISCGSGDSATITVREDSYLSKYSLIF